jgi:diamine N-acetyltransferase
VKLQIKAARAKDIPKITELATRIWNDYYPAIIGQEQVDYMLAKIYNSDSLLQQMEDGQKYYLINNGDAIAGFIAVSLNSDTFGFIHKFYVESKLYRQGLGTQTFGALLMEYPEITHWRLQVNRKNIQAINFYFKMGFIIEEAADFDIDNGYFMNDFVMLWKQQYLPLELQ